MKKEKKTLIRNEYKVQIALNISDELMDKILVYGEEYDWTKTKAIRNILKKFFEMREAGKFK